MVKTICSVCGGPLRIIASIEDPLVIRTILDHLAAKASSKATVDQHEWATSRVKSDRRKSAVSSHKGWQQAIYASYTPGRVRTCKVNDRDADIGLDQTRVCVAAGKEPA